MMYVHAPNGVFKATILPGEVYEFSSRCKTTAKRLTPEEATEYGVSLLKLVTPPAYDPATHGRQDIEPVFADGVWMQQWEVYALDAETVAAKTEAQAAQVRAERNQKLVASDWTQVADAPVDQAGWAAYRQSLREISAQEGFPWTVNWPVAP